MKKITLIRLFAFSTKIRFTFFILLYYVLPNLQAQVNLEFTPIWLPQTNWLINQTDDRAGSKLDFALSYSLKNYGILLGVRGKKIGLESGFITSNQGQMYKERLPNNVGEIEKFSTEVRLSYYKIPLLFFYKSNNDERRTGLILKLGGQMSLLQKAQYFLDGNETIYYSNGGNVFNIKEAYKRFNVDLVAGIGFIRTITKNFSFYTMLRVDYSVNDIEKKDLLFEGQPFFPPERLSTFAGTAGVSIGLTLKL